MAKRLLETHPTSKKVDELLACMERLGLSLEETGMGLVLNDKMYPDTPFFIMMEGGYGCTEFPGGFEFKLIIKEDGE